MVVQVNPGTAVNVWRSTAHENEDLPLARACPIWQNWLTHSVATVDEAAKLLRGARWPVKPGLNHARIACIEALAGADTCHDVRAKFVEAAREAGVLLGGGGGGIIIHAGSSFCRNVRERQTFGRAMRQIHFDRPVCISFGKAGKTRLVHTVWEAVRCLASDKWPSRAGPMCEMADHALRGAVRGQVTAAEARQAFADAALEARILVDTDLPRRARAGQPGQLIGTASAKLWEP